MTFLIPQCCGTPVDWPSMSLSGACRTCGGTVVRAGPIRGDGFTWFPPIVAQYLVRMRDATQLASARIDAAEWLVDRGFGATLLDEKLAVMRDPTQPGRERIAAAQWIRLRGLDDEEAMPDDVRAEVRAAARGENVPARPSGDATPIACQFCDTVVASPDDLDCTMCCDPCRVKHGLAPRDPEAAATGIAQAVEKLKARLAASGSLPMILVQRLDGTLVDGSGAEFTIVDDNDRIDEKMVREYQDRNNRNMQKALDMLRVPSPVESIGEKADRWHRAVLSSPYVVAEAENRLRLAGGTEAVEAAKQLARTTAMSYQQAIERIHEQLREREGMLAFTILLRSGEDQLRIATDVERVFIEQGDMPGCGTLRFNANVGPADINFLCKLRDDRRPFSVEAGTAFTTKTALIENLRVVRPDDHRFVVTATIKALHLARPRRQGTPAAIRAALWAVGGVRSVELHDRSTCAWMECGEVAAVVGGDFDPRQLARVLAMETSGGVTLCGSQHRVVRIENNEYTASWHTPESWAAELERHAKPADPLDEVIDGVSLGNLLVFDEVVRRDEGHTGKPPSDWQPTRFTPAARAALSAHWSAQLRAKIAGGESADAVAWRKARHKEKRQVRQVVLDCSEDL